MTNPHGFLISHRWPGFPMVSPARLNTPITTMAVEESVRAHNPFSPLCAPPLWGVL